MFGVLTSQWCSQKRDPNPKYCILWPTHSHTVDCTKSGSAEGINVLKGVEAVATGSDYNMMMKIDGSMWVTGRIHRDQIGDGNTRFTLGFSVSPTVVIDSPM